MLPFHQAVSPTGPTFIRIMEGTFTRRVGEHGEKHQRSVKEFGTPG
jgi:hypothetical protein